MSKIFSVGLYLSKENQFERERDRTKLSVRLSLALYKQFSPTWKIRRRKEKILNYHTISNTSIIM